MNELPELDELVQVGMFNILEERDVQIRGFPVRFDIDVLILFSANPSTYNRSGKVIPQLKDRIGSLIQTHYPRSRELGIEILDQEAGIETEGTYPVAVPYFMREIIEQITIQARQSKYIDQQSGVSARFSLANYRTMVASARLRSVVLGERPAVPRISDLGHLYSSSLGKTGARPDGQPPNVRAAGARRRAGGSNRHRLSRVRRQAWPGCDQLRFSARVSRSKSVTHYHRPNTRNGSSACRPFGTKRLKSMPPAKTRCVPRALNSYWPDCIHSTTYRALRRTDA